MLHGAIFVRFLDGRTLLECLLPGTFPGRCSSLVLPKIANCLEEEGPAGGPETHDPRAPQASASDGRVTCLDLTVVLALEFFPF